nr:MAG: major capsid protein [Microvirus sp.]
MRKTSAGSSNQHNFSTNAKAEIQRSQLDRSCTSKTSFDAGQLIPIFVEEVLPGDTMNLKMHNVARFATPLFPIMDNVYLDTHFFFVPNRILWTDWERFQGAQDNPDDSTDFLIPQVETEVGGIPEGSLFDFMGLPIGIDGTDFRADFGRAYNLIWNDWFRDENLQDSIPVKLDAGPDTLADYNFGGTGILPRGKRHDYFTSCLPFPQKGPAVTIPIGTTAPVIATGNAQPVFDTDIEPLARTLQTNIPLNAQVTLGTTTPIGAGQHQLQWVDPKLETDLSSATAATINSFRLAFQIQRVLERDARGGTRYVESIKSHFGVTSPDFRLQRPEYLGGGSQQLEFNAVPQTSQASGLGQTKQGNLAAFAVSVGSKHSFQKSFTEHGVIIGLISVRADLNYQQGMNRMWSRRTRYDFYIPALAHLGEQAVLNKEIYMQGTAEDDDVFGYQERWAEYRYKPNQITGRMRSTNSLPVDQWHLGQEFSSLPELGPEFIVEDPPLDRVVAVPSQPKFIMDSYFEYKNARPMPMRSTPGLIDHF